MSNIQSVPAIPIRDDPLQNAQWKNWFLQLTRNVNGTWGVSNGGTGINTYTIGDLLYASAATTLSKLADVAAGSYLRSGGVATAPVWSTTTLPNSATIGDLLYSSAANVYSNLADVATGNALISGGVATAPSWGKIGLTTHISGTLAVGNGGTGIVSLTVNRIPYGNDTSAFQSSADLTFNGTNLVVGSAGWTASKTAATGLTAQANARFAHGTSALATTATEGFMHVQSCAGTPTGVPASIPTGQIPMVYDSTNHRIYAYSGAWRSVAVA